MIDDDEDEDFDDEDEDESDYGGEDDDEDEDTEEDDRGPGWYEGHFGGPEDGELLSADLDGDEPFEAEDFEYESGGGIVTAVPLAAPIGGRRYQNICWQCHQSVDDQSMPRCASGCGWVRCRCGSCLCDMPLPRRLPRPHTVKIKHIPAAVRRCPKCGGVCFVPSEPEAKRREASAEGYVPDPAQYSPCSHCQWRGYLTE